MFALVRQVQIATDLGKNGSARLRRRRSAPLRRCQPVVADDGKDAADHDNDHDNCIDWISKIAKLRAIARDGAGETIIHLDPLE